MYIVNEQSKYIAVERVLPQIPISSLFFTLIYRGVEQLAARQAHNLKVTSSSLVSATKAFIAYMIFHIFSKFNLEW